LFHASKNTSVAPSTYAGPALAEHVIKPQIEAFNKIADTRWSIELYNATSSCPQRSVSRAMQRGTIDACA
jgi:hypothetical protein